MNYLVFLLYRALGAVIGALPIGFGIRLGRFIGLIGYFFVGKYRRIAVRNLATAFPEKTPRDHRSYARAHFATLVGNLFAAEKISRIPREEILPLVHIEGREIIENLIAQNRGVVLLGSHIGNWELLAQILPVIFECPIGTVYQQLGNRHIDAHVRGTRSRNGVALFERKEGFTAALDMLRKGGCVGVLFDQHAGDAGVWCPLFGRLASSTSLPAMMALRTKAALVPLAMNTDGVGKWKLTIERPVLPLENEAGAITAQLNLALEKQIRRIPADWFWVHNRWKTPKPHFLLVNYKRGIAYQRIVTTETAPESGSGELFEFAARKTAPPPQLQPFRILVRSSNWLGDAVMTIPALRAIKHGRPDAHVTVLVPAKLADIYRLIPEVDEIIAFPPIKGKGLLKTIRGIFHVFTVSRMVKRHAPFDAGILFPNSIRTAVELWLTGIERRVGFPGHNPRAYLLNQVLRDKKRKKKDGPAPPPIHQVNHYLRLAEFVGARPDMGFIVAKSEAETPEEKPRASVVVPRVRIAVCPGAEYGAAKRWLPERFAEVMRAVDREYETDWYLVGTAKDFPVADDIAKRASLPTVENTCGKTTLAQLIRLLRSCHVLVTNDTGTMHLASLLGVRTVSIFGSTEPLLTGPLGPGHVVLRHQVECSPCFLRDCPLDFRCMKAIEAIEVSAAICSIIDEGVEAK
jgi:heptosyltransferase II